jgi:hypothetical protein
MTVATAATERDDVEIDRWQKAMFIAEAQVRDIDRIRAFIGTVRSAQRMIGAQ